MLITNAGKQCACEHSQLFGTARRLNGKDGHVSHVHFHVILAQVLPWDLRFPNPKIAFSRSGSSI
jgi:hypothetical protein